MKKASICLIMVVAMLFGTAYADVEGVLGKTVTVNFSVANNEYSATTIRFGIEFDTTAFEFVSASAASTGEFINCPNSGTTKFTIASMNPISNGIKGTVTLRIKASAAIGTYTIKASSVEAKNIDEENVVVTVMGDKVIISCSHTPGEPIRENEVPATCKDAGSYDEVVKCSVCSSEISRTPKTIDKLTTHTPGEAIRENEVPATCKDAGSYVEVVKCSACGEELSRTPKTIEILPHTPGEAIRENEVPATCKDAGSYDEVVKCSVCGGEISRTSKTMDPLPHTPGEPVRENEVPATCKDAGSYDEVVKCSVCSSEISRTPKSIDKLDTHTPGEPIRENEVPATCKDEGSYDEVIKCAVCENELSRTPKTIDKLTTHIDADSNNLCDVCGISLCQQHTPGEPVRENEIPATCKEAGSYDEVVKCTACEVELTRTPKIIDKLTTHTPGEPVRENEVPATCKEAGSYEEVVKCAVCELELSRTPKTIDKLDTHTPGEPIRENEVPATCKDAGSYDEVVKCAGCGLELSRTPKTIDPLPHTPGEPIRENEVPATCKEGGSYEEVVKCAACSHELSRTPMTLDKLTTHTDDDGNKVCDICEKDLAPRVTSPETAQTVKVMESQYGAMSITADNAVSYQWYINRNDGKGFVKIEGAVEPSYQTSKVELSNDGYQYICVVSDGDETARSPIFTLKVEPLPVPPKTGDDSALLLWTVLCLGSLLLMMTMRRQGKKQYR